MSTTKRSRIQQAQVESELDQAISLADPLRIQSIRKLKQVRFAKARSQEREKSRLTQKLGAGHPRVMAMQARLETSNEVVRNLELESVRAGTEVPQVEPDDWLVHGRILNDRLEPVPGLKLALHDRSGCRIETCGSETADKTGYFNLTVKNAGKGTRIKATDDSKTTKGKRAASATDQASSDEVEGESTTNKRKEGFLYVYDRSNVILHRDKRSLAISKGQAQYLEIVIGDEDLDTPTESEARFLGNTASRVFHDLKNQQPGCRIDGIKAAHRVSFNTRKEALSQDYENCAYCFGKENSRD